MEHPPPRPRLQRSASERPAPLRRSSSLFGALGRVPWSTNDDDHFSSSGDDEPPPAPPSPSLSAEEAKASKRAVLPSVGRVGLGSIVDYWSRRDLSLQFTWDTIHSLTISGRDSIPDKYAYSSSTTVRTTGATRSYGERTAYTVLQLVWSSCKNHRDSCCCCFSHSAYWLPTRKNYFTRWPIPLVVCWTGKREQKKKSGTVRKARSSTINNIILHLVFKFNYYCAPWYPSVNCCTV